MLELSEATLRRKATTAAAARPGTCAGWRRWSRLARCPEWLLLVLLALLGGSGLAGAADDEFHEYKLKAALVYNFAKFVTWPTNSFATAESPMIVGILGEDPFGPSLQRTLKSKTANGRPFTIKHLTPKEDPKDCHILFISRSEKERIPSILAALKGQSVLTVSEVEKFAHNGGMINLLVVQESVRFEI